MRHRRAPLAVCTAIAVLAGTGLGIGTTTASAVAGQRPHRAGTSATPLLSARRVPSLVSDLDARASLDIALDAALQSAPVATSPPAAPGQTCLDVAQGSTQLYASNVATPLIPASNLKLLTVTAALDRLGPQSTYITQVSAEQAPVGGVVHGNLYLIGSGDPLLRTAAFVASRPSTVQLYTHLQDLAAAVRASGITQVTGSVVGDESRFDTQRYVPTWSPSYAAQGDVGPLSALEVDDGFEQVGTGWVADPQPAVQAADTFANLLRADGVTIGGAGASGVTPATAVAVTAIASAPLSQIVGEILRESDDDGAELLIKELGLRFGGAGTTAAGVAVMDQDLAADGLPLTGFTAVDGSGLDRSDRVTCQLVLAALVRAGFASPLVQGLPLADRSGTLQYRLGDTPAAGRVLAKTGTLNGVGALSGYVVPAVANARAKPLVFALIVNGVTSPTTVDNIEDAIAVALAAASPGPSPTALGPLPLGTGGHH